LLHNKRIRLIAEARQVVRPVCVSVVAIGILAVVMAFVGWGAAGVVLGGIIAGIAALMVLQVHWAIRHLHFQSHSARRAADEAEEHYVEVLWSIVRYVEARDRIMDGHSERVSELAEQIARKMRLGGDRCRTIRLAGRLHDVGMIAVPEKIIKQRSRLGVEGFRTIMQHPEVAYQLLKPLNSLAGALPAIRHHHERMNGTGYPAELSGKDIPLDARILAVADAYDAMTHDRPSRPAMAPVAAMQELRRCTPAGYDPACVEALAGLKHIPALEKVMAAAEQGQAATANRAVSATRDWARA